MARQRKVNIRREVLVRVQLWQMVCAVMVILGLVIAAVVSLTKKAPDLHVVASLAPIAEPGPTLTWDSSDFDPMIVGSTDSEPDWTMYVNSLHIGDSNYYAFLTRDHQGLCLVDGDGRLLGTLDVLRTAFDPWWLNGNNNYLTIGVGAMKPPGTSTADELYSFIATSYFIEVVDVSTSEVIHSLAVEKWGYPVRLIYEGLQTVTDVEMYLITNLKEVLTGRSSDVHIELVRYELPNMNVVRRAVGTAPYVDDRDITFHLNGIGWGLHPGVRKPQRVISDVHWERESASMTYNFGWQDRPAQVLKLKVTEWER